MIRFRLPYPISANKYWRHAVIPMKARDKNGRRIMRAQVYVSEEGKLYHQRVKAAIAQQLGWGFDPLHGRLRVTLLLINRDRRSMDLGNAEKIAMDSLTKAGVWDDDKQIDDLRIVRGGIQKPGHLDVAISVIREAERQMELFP